MINKGKIRAMKRLILSASLFFLLSGMMLSAQQYLYEGFESGGKPEGWTEEYVTGTEPWRYRNGGHSPNDNNWDIPPDEYDPLRNPDQAFEGTYNAIFFKQGDNNERTKLITPPIDMLGAANVQMSFYLCQRTWTFEGSVGWDIMRVYYKTGEEEPWNLLHEYLDPIYDWERQTLALPEPNETYYIAFEAQTRWGYGTCIDSIAIRETGSTPMFISQVTLEQPFEEFIPSDNEKIPMARVDLRVLGNTGSVDLNDITFTSLNTSDDDILPGGLNLYATTTQEFKTDNPLGSATGFTNGEVTFSGLSHSLPRGLSYVWLTFDIAPDAGHENVLDLMLKANSVSGGGETFPPYDQDPEGSRTIYSTIFKEDFEGTPQWTLSPGGEWEIAPPQGQGGSPGNPDPSKAYSGVNILGTDLTGLGANLYRYEPSISEASSYIATSPVTNALYYKNLNIFYQRYLNIEFGDIATLQVSDDDGGSWNSVWESFSFLTDFAYVPEQVIVPDTYSRTSQFRMRFKLGPTDGWDQYSGWNIDDVYLTGEFISKDVGISEWITPESGSGHTSKDTVKVRINNYGGAAITDPVPVAFSLNNGTSWTINNMDTDIPVGGSVEYTFTSTADLSTPGAYPNVLAKTFLPGDQFIGNDQLATSLYIIPTYTPPHLENFETNNGYWQPSGISLWEHGVPSGFIINSASSGSKVWETGLSENYGDKISSDLFSIFEDNFETDQGWTFNGEFERATPSNQYTPNFANSGNYCIGTDLSGDGLNPYLYENNINSDEVLTAVSPAINVTNWSGVRVSIARYLELAAGDSVRIDVSDDDGVTWHPIWKNEEGAVDDGDFIFYTHFVPEELTFTSEFRVRFTLFYSSSEGTTLSGWNIDDFSLQGYRVDLQPAYLASPSYNLTGLNNPVFQASMWMETEPGMDGATLQYSLDNAETWTSISNPSGYDSYWKWYTGNYVSGLGESGWSGSTGEWITVRHLLPGAVKGKDNVQFRLKFNSDKSNNDYEGIAIDDVTLFEAPDDAGVEAIVSPTSQCYLSDQQTFGVTLRNYGPTDFEAGDTLHIGYLIDREGDIQTGEEYYIMGSGLASGNATNISLQSPFDMSTSGSYTAKVFTIEDDPYFYYAAVNDTATAIISVNKPTVDLGPDISTSDPDTVLLDASSGEVGNTYTWQDDSHLSTFDVQVEGTYWVEVSNGSCTASDTVRVLELILDVGVDSLVSPQSSCELGSQENVSVVVKNFGTDTLNIQDTIVVVGELNLTPVFRDTVILSDKFRPGESFLHSFSDPFDFSVPDAYPMRFYTEYSYDEVASNDMVSTTINVFGYPEIELGSDMVVNATEYLLDPGAGYASYLWQDGSSDPTFLVTQPGEAEYHVEVSDGNNCISYDTVNVNLSIVDVELTEILSPSSSCEIVTSVTISARATNRGNQVISSGETLSLAYTMQGGPEQLENFPLSEDLAPGESVDLVFSSSESVSNGSTYNFVVYVGYASDLVSSNDTLLKSVGIYEPPVVDLGESYQVVTGFEYTLDAGPGFVSYLWQDESTNQTYTIDEPGIANYNVTVTDGNGCQAYDEVTLLLAVPDVGIGQKVSPSSACTLSAEEALKITVKNYGSYPIAPTENIQVSYSVNGSDAVVESLVFSDTLKAGEEASHTFSTAVDMSAAGNYQFVISTIYAADLVTNNDVLFSTVDVLGAPLVDIGNGEDTLFISKAITLMVDAGYASYLWQDGNTTNNYSISEPSAGMYSVTVTADNECVTRDSVYVVFDIPDLEFREFVSPTNACELGSDQTVTVELVNRGFYFIPRSEVITVTYSVNNQSSVIENFQLEENLMPGDSVELTFPNGYDFSETDTTYSIFGSLIWLKDKNGPNNSYTTMVEVYGNPVVDISGGEETIYTDFPYTLDAGSGFFSYLWQDNVTTSTTFEATEEGQYSVTVTNEYGCEGSDEVYLSEPVGILSPEALGNFVEVYPNPAEEFVKVILDAPDKQEVIIELYTIDNKKLVRKEVNHQTYTEVEIDVRDLAPGSYYLRIRNSEGHYSKLIVVI
jgi:hypothetical protein